MTATQTTLITIADLEAMGNDAEHLELIEGVTHEMSPAGNRHGRIASLLDRRLGTFVETHGLGETFGAETGFVVARNPDSVLAPDLSFVATDRLPKGGEEIVGFTPFAPDLAVEIASPSNSESEMLLKTAIYLAGGVRTVWLVRPQQQTVTVFTPDAPERILSMGEALDGGEVVPGFSLPLSDIFRQA